MFNILRCLVKRFFSTLTQKIILIVYRMTAGEIRRHSTFHRSHPIFRLRLLLLLFLLLLLLASIYTSFEENCTRFYRQVHTFLQLGCNENSLQVNTFLLPHIYFSQDLFFSKYSHLKRFRLSLLLSFVAVFSHSIVSFLFRYR